MLDIIRDPDSGGHEAALWRHRRLHVHRRLACFVVTLIAMGLISPHL
jgi:hypothetical protein